MACRLVERVLRAVDLAPLKILKVLSGRSLSVTLHPVKCAMGLFCPLEAWQGLLGLAKFLAFTVPRTSSLGPSPSNRVDDFPATP